MKIDEVFEEVLKRTSLPKKDFLRYERIAKDFIRSLEGVGIGSFIGGSFAKGTVVREERQDIDIFVVFETEVELLKLEGILKGKELPGKLKIVHGSRDYFQINCGEVTLEVVPVVKNLDPENARNVTDVSLSHVGYIRNTIKKLPRVANDVRVAKAFCKANNFYGAEGYIHGFSGYSLEVLVTHFQGFEKFLKGMIRLVEKGGKVVIDPKKYFRNRGEILREINGSKLEGPVVLVDPTHKCRNACAGLGAETFEIFIEVAKKFLKDPSLKFFEKRGVDVSYLSGVASKKGARFVEIDLITDRQEGDIAGTKCKKFFDFFVKELERNQQKVLKKVFEYSGEGKRAKGYLIVEEKGEIEVRGPGEDRKDSVEVFKEVHRDKVYKRGKNYFVKEKSGIKVVFDKVGRVESEMGAGGEIKIS